MRYLVVVLAVGCSGGEERAGVLVDGAGGSVIEAGSDGAATGGVQSAGGAAPEAGPVTCASDAECDDGKACVYVDGAKRCRPTCETFDDCAGERCVLVWSEAIEAEVGIDDAGVVSGFPYCARQVGCSGYEEQGYRWVCNAPGMCSPEGGDCFE